MQQSSHHSPPTVQPSPVARAVAWPLLALVRLYQRAISPLLPPSCRFTPSCSHYAVDALHQHHLPRALGLILWRLARCQPFCAGGHDPVPPGPFASRTPTRSHSRMAA